MRVSEHVYHAVHHDTPAYAWSQSVVDAPLGEVPHQASYEGFRLILGEIEVSEIVHFRFESASLSRKSNSPLHHSTLAERGRQGDAATL